MAPALLALLALAGPVSGVAPDTVPPVVLPAPGMPAISVAVTGGTFGAADLQRQPVLAEILDEEGEVTATHTLARRLELVGGAQLQVSATAALDESWSVRVGGGVGRARIAQEFDGADVGVARAAAALPVDASPRLELRSLEGAVQYRIRPDRRFQPYLEVGVGVERWTSSAAPDAPYPGADALVGTVTRYASHGALGAEWPLVAGLALRVQGTVRAVRTPLEPAEAGRVVATGDTLRLTLAPHQAGVFADRAVATARITRFEAGLRYGFGVSGGPARPTPAPDAGQSAPRP